MFCSLLKPNHSTTVFSARKTEINLFICLYLTNKPYTQLTINTVSSYQTKPVPFSFIVQHMPAQSTISLNQNTQLLIRQTDPNKNERPKNN